MVDGTFTWLNLMTTDAVGALAFYRRVLGWGTDVWGGDYQMFLFEGAAFGGIRVMPEDTRARPHWLPYVNATDVEARVEAIHAAGGTLLHPITVQEGVGAWAVFRDPQGAILAIIQQDPVPAEAPALPAGTVWMELTTADHHVAFAFYAACLGWEKTGSNDLGPLGEYRLFGIDGESFGAMWSSPPSVMWSAAWLPYFHSDDLDVAAARVREEGGRVLHGPTEVPGETFFLQCRDPQGAMFAMHSPRRPAGL